MLHIHVILHKSTYFGINVVAYYNYKINIQISFQLCVKNKSEKNRQSNQKEVVGRELVKSKQAGECLPQIVELSGRDLSSILKNLILGMTRYETNTRATTEKARLEKRNLCSWTGTYISYYSPVC